MYLKKPLSNFLIICFLVVLPLPAGAQKATEDTKISLEKGNDSAQAKSLALSFMRIAQSLVGLALAINLALVIKRVYQAKGEGGSAIIGWFSAVMIWMVMSQVIIRLMASNISQ